MNIRKPIVLDHMHALNAEEIINTIICKNPANTPAKCALCEGSHPANYKGCEVYKNLQQARGKPTNMPRYNTRQSNININDTNQFPSINTNQPQNQMHSAPQN
ncbi:unnamed protein product [Psylliodes chrysocephalus]|uniref:Uncharacterized protein n=1 Tax=Psylliodes chrysocephalus TaxID=3402493 RepID=A0A9P0GK24_9CUCU|nr:unnamed protein product [Psylliodes chrysocephala]